MLKSGHISDDLDKLLIYNYISVGCENSYRPTFIFIGLGLIKNPILIMSGTTDWDF